MGIVLSVVLDTVFRRVAGLGEERIEMQKKERGRGIDICCYRVEPLGAGR
jgi:hypothetical protein